MASIFDYQFNVGGNFTAAVDGMAESTGRFNAAVETSTRGLSKWEQKLATFGLISDYMERVNHLANAGASTSHNCRGIMRIDNKLFNLNFIEIFNK